MFTDTLPGKQEPGRIRTVVYDDTKFCANDKQVKFLFRIRNKLSAFMCQRY